MRILPLINLFTIFERLILEKYSIEFLVLQICELRHFNFSFLAITKATVFNNSIENDFEIF